MQRGAPGKLREVAAAFFEKPPTDAELAGLGLRRSDLADAEVWPDNWPVFRLFSDLQTQWRVGASGPTGLDYMVLYRKLDRMGLSDDEYAEFENDIRVMEFAALDEIHRKDD